MFIVFDLDGTLRDPEARVNKHLIDQTRGHPHMREYIDWDAFFLDCDLDDPIPHTLEVLRALYNDGHEIQIWTGCGAIAREKTVAWLILHGVPEEIVSKGLVMRPIGDTRDDDEMKRDWIAHYGTPDLVFEDRNRVAAMWRRMGIPCYHVADAPF